MQSSNSISVMVELVIVIPHTELPASVRLGANG